jgi:hypothetical protein
MFFSLKTFAKKNKNKKADMQEKKLYLLGFGCCSYW